MVKMQLEKVTKEIQENLVPDYERLGWKIVKKPEKKEDKGFNFSNKDE